MASTGAMLRLARQMEGIKQNEAAQQLGVSPNDLSRMENDTKEPTAAFLEKAAGVFKVPADFFHLTDRIYGAPVSVHPMFRKKSDVTAGDMDKVIAELNIRVMHLRRLLQATDLNPVRTIPQFDIEEYGDPEKIAGLLRAHWMIPAGPIKNLTAIVEEAGIVVAHSAMGGSTISGVTFRVPGMPPLILLNTDQPADRMRHTLCHELGHIVMHQFPTPNMEKEADLFAGCFMAPTRDIKPYFGPGRVDLARLAALKPEWRMSMASLVFAADRAGKFQTQQQKNYMWQQFSAAKIRLREPPELDFPKEVPTILSDLLKLHIENMGYSFAELAKVLRMREEVFPSFYEVALPGNQTSRGAGLRVIK